MTDTPPDDRPGEAAPSPLPEELPPLGVPPSATTEASEPPPPPDAALKELSAFFGSEFQSVREELATLRDLFDTRFLRDKSSQQIIDKLHASLREAEADTVWNIRRPILAELVQIYDALSDELAKPEAPAVLRRFLEDVEDLLLRLGVEPYRTDGDQFDARTQTLKRAIPALSPEMVGTIAERLRPGFKSDRHTLRAEAVAVYVRAQPSAPPPAQPPAKQGDDNS